MSEKICTKCRVKKPETLEFFPRNQDGKKGFRSHCRICTNASNRATHARNKHRWHKAKRNYWLKRHYGIETEDYESILAQQGGGCAICTSPSPKRAKQIYFSVDHCHKTGRVRGLLCVNCNTLIGLMESIGPTQRIVANALAYLQQYDAAMDLRELEAEKRSRESVA